MADPVVQIPTGEWRLVCNDCGKTKDVHDIEDALNVRQISEITSVLCPDCFRELEGTDVDTWQFFYRTH
jgi:hypothetical protein